MLLSISFYRCGRSSGVERNLAKVDVEGPNPFARSNTDKAPLWGLYLYLNVGKDSDPKRGSDYQRKRYGGIAVSHWADERQCNSSRAQSNPFARSNFKPCFCKAFFVFKC